jgi:GT2 family glycosyltransferase
MQISVLIPVYNAAPYVRQAVESALAQPETAEVVLVEDASPDDSLAVCQALVVEYPDRVRLFRHPSGENRGAGASRNLAIEKSRYPFIAFLDADDYYLPGRFAVTRRVFEEKPYVDGVYEAIGAVCTDVQVRERLEEVGLLHLLEELTIPSEPLEGHELFVHSLGRLRGHFSIIGLTIKRSLADAVGPLATHLRLHQDTDYIFRLTAKGYLAPGMLEKPIAVRRLHEANRFTAKRTPEEVLYHRMLQSDNIIQWAQSNVDVGLQPGTVLRYRVPYLISYCRQTHKGPIAAYFCLLGQLCHTAFRYPIVIRDRRFWILFSPYPALMRRLPEGFKQAMKRFLRSRNYV